MGSVFSASDGDRATSARAGRTPGVLLVAGFAALIPGLVIASGSQTETSYIPPTLSNRVGAVSLIAGVTLTLLGFLAFDPVLWRAGDPLLSGLGTAAYSVAAVSWVVATAHALTSHEWPYDREVTYIVAAGISMVAFGAAVIRTRAIPCLLGWVAVAWRSAGLILFVLPYDGYPPLLAQPVPLLFGVALLRESGA